jgi:8-oxo-dGTP pyrophosphatase MutT (NUDIX family)
VQEETGLVVIPSSVKEYGMVHRIQKGDIDDIFVQDNYYYFCEVEDIIQNQNLDDYEDEENFTLEFVKISDAIKVNKEHHHGEKDKDIFYQMMIERDSRVLEMLLEL